jgi:hypothetical protein
MNRLLIINRGEIGFVRSSSLVGRLIQFFENVNNYLNDSEGRQKQFNHVFLGLSGGMIGEAEKNGIQYVDFLETYGKKKNIEILIYQIPLLNEIQLQDFEDFARQFGGVPYQFDNFGKHIVNILTDEKLWIERKKKRGSKLFCSEFVAMVCHTVLRFPAFEKWWKIRPDEVLDHARKNWILKRRYKN